MGCDLPGAAVGGKRLVGTASIARSIRRAALWHLLLIVTEKERAFYSLYALIDLPIFYLLWAFALVIALQFP
jgi:hypothetical protein